MDSLYLLSEGIRGKGLTTKKKGYIEAQYNGDYVFVDNFEGKGNSYKIADKPRICFKIDGKSYQHTFESLKKQLDK